MAGWETFLLRQNPKMWYISQKMLQDADITQDFLLAEQFCQNMDSSFLVNIPPVPWKIPKTISVSV